jgi:integrase
MPWKHKNKWRGEVSVGDRRMSKVFDTKREASKWERDMRQRVSQGLSVKATRIRVSDYLVEWFEYHKSNLSINTAKGYSQRINLINKHLPNITLDKLRPMHIKRLYARLSEDRPPTIVRNAHSVLSSALGSAVNDGLIPDNPASRIKFPSTKKRTYTILDESQAIALLSVASNSRYEAAYHIAIKTGMRRGEIFGLMWSDIDWSGSISIERTTVNKAGIGIITSTPKSASSRRTIMVGGSLLAKLREHRERQIEEIGNQKFIFTEPDGSLPSEARILNDLRRLLETAGLPRIRFHDLRHTAASIMLNNNIPVMVVSSMLGHSSPSITLDVYGHLIHSHQIKAVMLMDELDPIKIYQDEER